MVPRTEEGTPKRREHIVVVTESSCRDADRQQPCAVDGCCGPAVTDLRGGAARTTGRGMAALDLPTMKERVTVPLFRTKQQ